MKFAVLSSILPPSASGQTMVLYHLLKGFSKEDYCLISQQDYTQPSPDHDYTELLPARYHTLPVDKIILRGGRFSLPQRLGLIYIPLGLISRALHIASILRREGVKTLVSCTSGWDCLNMPAGFLAARIVGIPYCAYVFDYYSKQWEGPNYWGNGDYVRLARLFESILMKGAAGIIVPNEFLGDELRERYGVDPTVIHNCCDLSRYQLTYHERQIGTGGEGRIVYTGDIYDAHFDAFANLLEAIRLTGRTDMKLHAYTIRSITYLREHGVDGPLVLHPHAANASMPDVQAEADVLFLALAFRSPYPAGNRTAAPGKIGEYLASGRPVLVHAPHDSFAAWYFRKYECGLVIDEDNPAALARALQRLLNDEALRRMLVTNALNRARSDFSIEATHEQFIRLLRLNDNLVPNVRQASSKHASVSGSS